MSGAREAPSRWRLRQDPGPLGPAETLAYPGMDLGASCVLCGAAVRRGKILDGAMYTGTGLLFSSLRRGEARGFTKHIHSDIGARSVCIWNLMRRATA